MTTPGGTEAGPLDLTVPPSRVRRRVTLVFSDLKGSTALAERLDAETLRAVLGRYFDEMRIVIESHGGRIVKIIGDAIVAVFDGVDDPEGAARHAARAALESQAALEWLNDRFDATWGVRLENRTGVASGELSVADLEDGGDADGRAADVLAGDVVGWAESLEANAPAMEVLVDGSTVALLGDAATVEDVRPVRHKHHDATIDAWVLVGVRAPQDGTGSDGAPGAARPTSEPSSRDASTRQLSALELSRESRRTVTIVFADPKPARLDGNPLGADATRAVMARYFDTMCPILEHHGGTVEKFIGDALMAVFGLPVRHEDDALRALRAASDMQRALVRLNDELVARHAVRFANPVGVNTGTVVASDGTQNQRLVTGDAVNVAARFEQTAKAGEVVIGELTRQLAGPAVEVEALPPLVLKGKAEPVKAHRLVRVAAAGAAQKRYDLPLVGRDDELGVLRAAFQGTVAEARARRVTVVGDAGVGKSRLTHEFLAEVGRSARILEGSCLAYGEGITFWPLLRLVQAAAGVEEGDDADTARERVAQLGGDDPDVGDRLMALAGLSAVPFAVPELVWALRRLLERLATQQPLVVVFDDVHWAESTFLDAVDELGRTVAGRVMILCTARPSLTTDHGEFVDAAPAVVLQPLTDDDCVRFLRILLGESDVDPSVIRRVVDAAGGNPLFIEQLLSMLIDRGRLREENGRWIVSDDLSTLDVPASIEALFAARLDLLVADERHVLEPASIIGRRFVEDAVRHLVPDPVRPAVARRLDDLCGRDLLEHEYAEDAAYRFQHQLIRDATYRGILKRTRAVLHERFVEWADAVNAARDRATEFEEIQGYHLEQAYRYWSELGPVDDRVAAIGTDASRRLASAGERAYGRGDMPAAANLLRRAAALLPEGHESTPRLLLLAANALHEIGDFDVALDTYAASARAADAAGAPEAREAADLDEVRLRYLIGRIDDPADVTSRLEEAFARLGPDGDPDALSRAWQLRLNVEIAACRWANAQTAADNVIAHAARAGNATLEIRTMPLLAFLAQKGPMPVADAVDACREILRRVSFDRRSSGLTQLELALLSAMALDFGSARRLYDDTRRTLVELGWQMQTSLVSLSSGPIELLADDPVRAEAELRQDYESLRSMDERNFISLTATLLADAVYRQRRFDEAQELCTFGRDLAAPDDLAVHIVAGGVTAKLAARAGDRDTACASALEALRLVEGTDDPSGQGDALLDLAEVLFLTGDREGAEERVAAAARRYDAKGNRAGLRRAERYAERVAAGQDPLP